MFPLTRTIKIFYTYAHADNKLRNELEKHLSLLKRQGEISAWHDREIGAGQEWAKEIDVHLNDADVILLLVSPDFMASDYCYDIEVKRALERHDAGEARVIPVILRPVDWHEAPFGKLKPLPTDGKPISRWSDRDEAFYDVVRGIRESIEEWNASSSVISSASNNVAPADIQESPSSFDRYQIDWGEALQTSQFYGRENELAELQHWIMADRCRIVAVLGMGGIGKTSLVVRLVEQVKDGFIYVFWRSLQNAPPLKSIMLDCIRFVSNQRRTNLPEDVDGQISLLLDYLLENRSLIVLDNVESILQAGNRAGQYREGYEGYGKLFQRLGEARHQSCLLLTSREKPREVALLEGKTSPVRLLQLLGLGQVEGREILQDKGLFGSEEDWAKLIHLYSGNPLALKLVSEPVREVFEGDISGFLKEDETVLGDIHVLLDQQFQRLSQPEQEIMYWLAIEREAVSLGDLREDTEMIHSVSKELLDALNSLRRRSMIETTIPRFFTLQPVIMEYVTNLFVEQTSEEINDQTLKLFISHALIKVQAKDYVRESQKRLILIPIVEQLLTKLERVGFEKKLRSILSTLRDIHPQIPGYAAGNVLNLLAQSGCNPRGYDFSNLTVCQAYLQDMTLLDMNFAHANFVKSVFTQNFGGILSTTFSPDGELLAAGTTNNEIRIWQVHLGTLLLTCQGHTDWVRSVAFSPDGRTLASGSDDQMVRLWEVSTGSCTMTLQGHTNLVRSVAFSPDGRTLASGSDDQTVRLWEVSTGSCTMTLQGHTSWVRSVAFSPDGRMLASGSDDQTVRLWEVSTGSCTMTLQECINRVRSVAFSPDGRTLASGSDDQTVRLWEVSTGQSLSTLEGHTDEILLVAFSPDGRTLASCSEDQMVRLWEVSTGSCLRTLQGHINRVWSVAFSPDGRTLASGSDDQTVRLWEVSTGHCLMTQQGHTNVVRSVAFSPDSQFLANVCEDQFVRLWEVSTGRCLRTLQGHTNWGSSVAFSPDGRTLASGSDDQTVRLWEVSTGHCLKTLQGHISLIRSVAFSPDGSMLASGSEDQTVRLWDVSTGSCLRTLQGHTHRVWSVAFSPDGHTLASGSDDETVRLWELNTDERPMILQEPAHWVRSVAFSSDGKILASGSFDKTIRLWEVGTGRYLRTLQGHTDQIWSVAFSSNGKILASGSNDGTIKLWDAQTSVCLKTLISERPYERMNITNVEGLTEAQKTALRALGAFEDKEQAFA